MKTHLEKIPAPDTIDCILIRAAALTNEKRRINWWISAYSEHRRLKAGRLSSAHAKPA
jgi:hypothetical protein